MGATGEPVGSERVCGVIEITGVGLVFPLLLVLVSPEYLDRLPSLSRWLDQAGLGRGLALSVFLLCMIAVLMIGKNAYMIFFNWRQF